jgi:hypothetical protein
MILESLLYPFHIIHLTLRISLETNKSQNITIAFTTYPITFSSPLSLLTYNLSIYDVTILTLLFQTLTPKN